MPALLGCIADDLTGGTDLAGLLVRHGLRALGLIGVPAAPPRQEVDAFVVALKSRSSHPREAAAQSVASAQALRQAGCEHLYFKYCSTFDSTDRGNIGPVIDALMEDCGTKFTVACPAFPENGRTVYNGHLYVGDALLNESGMQHHPLTPMKDANLVRVLRRQTTRRVGLVRYATVASGADAIRAEFEALQSQGVEIAVVDAVFAKDLLAIGEACSGMPLVTGGSALGLGLMLQLAEKQLLQNVTRENLFAAVAGSRAIISGSCSSATSAQLGIMIEHGAPAFAINSWELTPGNKIADLAVAWAAPLLGKLPVLIYASALKQGDRTGEDPGPNSGHLIEATLSTIAQGLYKQGVRQMIVAGGETSGAVAKGLGVAALQIGPEIDPGVPWTNSIDGPPITLALKSGNFGSPDFFLRAWEMLP